LAALSLPLLGFARNLPSHGNRPAIIVRVFNEARLDAATLRRAERQAAKIFEDAGIQSLVETGTGPFSSYPVGGREFLVRIVDRKPLSATPEMLGFVGVDQVSHVRFAAAYEPAVEKTAKGFACETDQVLGTVMVHEIGHLILGPAHARGGIMHPRWGPLEFLLIKVGALEFTPEEAGRLRNEAGRVIAARLPEADVMAGAAVVR
jgi:hypothetical protein